MKIAVVGGGIFGVTIAIKFAELGYAIDLFEMSGKILSCATGCNQFRMHRGYHYPRSKTTAREIKKGYKAFTEFYGECLLENSNHYYCIGNRYSRYFT